jgi:hypothetical protein
MNFVEPPQSRLGRPLKYMTPEVQDALRQHPGQWAQVLSGADDNVRSSVAHWVRRHEGYEITVRTAGRDDNGRLFDIYVRYVGQENSHDVD